MQQVTNWISRHDGVLQLTVDALVGVVGLQGHDGVADLTEEKNEHVDLCIKVLSLDVERAKAWARRPGADIRVTLH